jgi:hypothetical protein
MHTSTDLILNSAGSDKGMHNRTQSRLFKIADPFKIAYTQYPDRNSDALTHDSLRNLRWLRKKLTSFKGSRDGHTHGPCIG